MLRQKFVWLSVISFSCLGLATAFLNTAPPQPARTDVLWSSARANLKDNEGNVTIPTGINLVFDGGSDSAPPASADRINDLTIHGTFTCAPGARTLVARNITVAGANAAFICGTTQSPRIAPFTIQFYAYQTRNSAGNQIYTHGRFIVDQNAHLSLVSEQQTSWVRLGRTASAGDNYISTENKVYWPVGSEVVVASSSFEQKHTEVLRITSNPGDPTRKGLQFVNLTNRDPRVSESASQLGNQLLYTHWGGAGPETHGGNFSLENRAEVGLITRPIKITGEALPCTLWMTNSQCYALLNSNRAYSVDGKTYYATRQGPDLQFGHGPVGSVQISGVEFSGMGKMDEMGRYPIHWHHVGQTFVKNSHTSFVQDSVVRDSFSRCVTIHQTHGVVLDDNVCFNHFGHGFFLEDGNEVGNQITNNLGIGSKKIPNAWNSHLLISDVESGSPGRFPSPATYWISNPDNTINNNVAAGSEGSGFWFALKDEKHKVMEHDMTTHTEVVMRTTPNTTPIREFNGNLAHSTLIGFTFDGGPNGACQTNPRNPGCNVACDTDSTRVGCDRSLRTGDFKPTQTRYEAGSAQFISGITAYKNRELGFWNLANRVHIRNGVFADNRMAVALVFGTKLIDSAIVARSNKFVPVNPDLPENVNHPDNVRVTNFRYELTSNPVATHDDRHLRKFSGVRLYDGPFALENVSFINFDQELAITPSNPGAAAPLALGMFGAAANRSSENQVSGLRFIPEPRLRADFYHELGHHDVGNWATAVIDKDGSLTGKPGQSVLPLHEMNIDPGCMNDVRFLNARVCPGKFGTIFVARDGSRFDLTKTRRTSSQPQVTNFVLRDTPAPNQVNPTAKPEINYFTFSFNHVDRLEYEIKFKEDFNLRNPVGISLMWADRGAKSPPIKLSQKLNHCSVVREGAGSTILRKTSFDATVEFKGELMYPVGFGQHYTSQVHLRCVPPEDVNFASSVPIKSGNWSTSGNDVVATSDRSTIDIVLNVTPTKKKVRIVTKNGPDRGLAEIQVGTSESNLVRVQDIDLYAGKSRSVESEIGNSTTFATPGTYRIRIIRKGQKRMASTDKKIALTRAYTSP